MIRHVPLNLVKAASKHRADHYKDVRFFYFNIIEGGRFFCQLIKIYCLSIKISQVTLHGRYDNIWRDTKGNMKHSSVWGNGSIGRRAGRNERDKDY